MSWRLSLTSIRLRTISALCALVAALCAVSPASLWIDEFGTWALTRANSTSEWWTQLSTWRDSDSQAPVYHYYMFLWTHLFGTGVVSMRASNIPLFAIATMALVWPLRRSKRIGISVLLAATTNAAVWYYLNELRPYIMLYMGMCLMVGAVIEIMTSQREAHSSAVWALCIGAVLTCGASVLGFAWAGSVALFIILNGLLVGRISIPDLLSRNWPILTLTSLLIAALLVHDIRMFGQGKLPSLIHESGIATLLFSFYAVFGLLGLGPGMLELRDDGWRAIVPYLPTAIFASAVLAPVAAAGLAKLSRLMGRTSFILFLACTFLPIAFTQILGIALHWRVLPRHLIPLTVIVSLVYGFGAVWWLQRGTAGRGLVAIAALVMAISAASVRLAPRHAKDDYERAAALATAELAHDGRVWWAADGYGASYYGVPIAVDARQWDLAGGTRKALLADSGGIHLLGGQGAPTLVIMSRPDTYDRENAVREYLRAHNYRLVDKFPAFTVWRP